MFWNTRREIQCVFGIDVTLLFGGVTTEVSARVESKYKLDCRKVVRKDGNAAWPYEILGGNTNTISISIKITSKAGVVVSNMFTGLTP